MGSYEFVACLGAGNAGLFLGCWFLIHDALLIECEQAFENLFVGKIDREAVGLSDDAIEFCVRVSEPGRTLVVKIRERALRQFLGAIFIARFDTRIVNNADAARVGIDHKT